jgi:L-lactate dehydrogenase complex protein LldG
VGVALSARAQILGRVRAALADVPGGELPAEVPVPRAYRTSEPGDPIARFVERVGDYGADVRRVRADEVQDAVSRICAERDVKVVATPPDLPAQWLPRGVEVVADAGLDVRRLDEIGAAITGCSLGIAETGTIALDGGPRQGRRALTLVPDLHVCLIASDQIVDGVPAAMRVLAGAMRERRPLTLVSGPSATSDIELSRVEGVHGPRQVVVLVIEG